MDARIGFVSDCNFELYSMTGLCDHDEISRKTGYKWLSRYREQGAAGLMDRSPAPRRHGRTTPDTIAEGIILLRQSRPGWGPRKIIAKLALDHPEVDWPVASTAGEILRRAGLVYARRLQRRAPPRLDPLTFPQHANQLWAVDHKGWVRLGDGSRAEPLTITDGFSRYLISAAATGGTTQDEARPVFERAFREHGLPKVIRSGNGTPFAAAGTAGLTALSAWWNKPGIRHERIDPGHPRQNGRHERFHRTLLEAMHPPAKDRAAQARRFVAFARDYNEERPHEALGQKTPASLYRPSPRPMPRKLPEPDYPAGRTARSSGRAI